MMATPLPACESSVSDPDVDDIDDLCDLPHHDWCEVPGGVPPREASSEPARGGGQGGDTDFSAASTCPTTARGPGARTVDEALALEARARTAHGAACADVDAAMEALAAAKHDWRRQPKKRESKAALAAAAADVTAAERRAEEAHTAMLAASQALDVAKLRALSTSGGLVTKEESPGARIFQQVLNNEELQREYCARHPQWRADLAHGLTYSAPAEADATEEVVLHAGHGAIGRRRTAACCVAFGTKHKVKSSRHCKLVARGSNHFFLF